MRVLLDTNVLVSGLLWRGPPNQLLRWTRDGVLDAICCEEMRDEFRRVIAYPKLSIRLSELSTSPGQAIAYLMNLVLHVPSPEHVPAVVSEDPSDDLLLATAAENGAMLIVSGDQHLLALEEHRRVPIVTPGEAVEVVRELLAR